ncbi:MAG: protein-L-isoaspartate(D-aspartate) O-methyltransferase [Candidatus Zhuqueibacterota bacterium]
MNQFFDAREKMVAEQLANRGISNQDILKTMRKIERHFFVDKKYWGKAYEDSPLPIPCSQTISQPYMVALMTELIEPNKSKRVLEIGTGSGYQTSILAELCKQVYSIERHQELADSAFKLLTHLGYRNIEITTTDGTLGWPEEALFDAIIVTAGAPGVPEHLVNQLKDGGRMVIPVGSAYQQDLLLVTKRSDSYITKTICGCIFVPLIGSKGWGE